MENEDAFVNGKGPSPTSTTPLSVRHFKRSERSCLTCHQRKIRCDKKVPCSHCMRADVLCCYPAPERTPRRPQKTTIAEIAARLARIERTITAISDGNPTQLDSNFNSVPARTTRPSHESEGATDETRDDDWPPDELLVQDGSSSRYINEALLSRVVLEEQELRSVLGGDSADDSGERKPSLFDIGGLFFDFNHSKADPQTYHPSRWHAMQLWQAFVNNVDPVAKILHIPSTQTIVYAAISNANEVDDDLSALLFSIYFAATASLSTTGAASLLGLSKGAALKNFKQGLEHSLAGANFLDRPCIKSLQALTIYLTCLRAFSGSRAVWTLNGLTIRSAQSMGLHRDGKNFNLSPFESESRRRLWWYICSQDGRCAEDLGIVLSRLHGYSDTSFPSNFNDSELSPDVEELPAENAKWTDMTFCLCMMKLGQGFQQLYRTPGNPADTTRGGEPPKVRIWNDLKAQIEKDLKHCDPNIPAQRYALLTTRLRLAKTDFLVSNRWLNCGDASQRKKTSPEARTTESALLAACQILEMNFQIQSDELLQGFRWFSETFVQYHVLTYALWHLCVKPVGPTVERAWKAVDESFEISERHKENVASEAGSKWSVIQRLRSRALQIRDSPRGKTGGSTMAVESDVLAARSGTEFSTIEFEDIPSAFAFGEGADWEMNMTDLPDWKNFIETYEMDANEFGGDMR